MTLREEQLLRVHSQKGRSASFCVGAADAGGPAELAAAAAPAAAAGWATPPHRPHPAAAARRSQSCKVPGARPRVRRRPQKDEALDLADSAGQHQEESYHPFLHKAPSCGKVFYQTADGTVMQTYTPEGSPGPVARAARRPPLPASGTPEESPSLARRPTRGRPAAGVGRSSPGSRYKKRANQEPDPDDPDAYRLRNFSLTAKG